MTVTGDLDSVCDRSAIAVRPTWDPGYLVYPSRSSFASQPGPHRFPLGTTTTRANHHQQYSVSGATIETFFLVKAEYWTYHHHQASREVPGPNTTTQQGVPSRLPRRRDDPNIEVRLWYHQAARQKGRTDYFIRSQPFDAQQRSIIAAAILLWERRCDISKHLNAS